MTEKVCIDCKFHPERFALYCQKGYRVKEESEAVNCEKYKKEN